MTDNQSPERNLALKHGVIDHSQLKAVRKVNCEGAVAEKLLSRMSHPTL